MKITESWKRRDEFIELCKKADACRSQFERLIEAKNEDDWLEVLYSNFSWCVGNKVLEEWLPDVVNAKQLYCYDCTGLKSLPDMPNLKWLDCRGCTGLTSLPDMPNLERLNCDERLR